MAKSSKLKVGVIGSGKIGTDLLIKIQRSKLLHCDIFVGRNQESPGIRAAESMGVNTSSESLNGLIKHNERLDLVFDATSAQDHKQHAIYFREAGIKAIDLTPAKVGGFCIPSIDSEASTSEPNVNMVTCGGQASIPVIHALSSIFSNISRVEVESHLAADSIGPATLANIDDYYSTTASAISKYTNINDVSVDLKVEESAWKPDMLTIIRAHTTDSGLSKLYEPLMERVAEVRKHVPGYHIVGTPSYRDSAIEVMVSVRGQGDWIPSYAGNLDIINCAAIAVAEEYALSVGIKPELEEQPTRESNQGPLGSLLGFLGKGNKALPEPA